MLCKRRLRARILRAPCLLTALAIVIVVNVCIGAYLLAQVVILSQTRVELKVARTNGSGQLFDLSQDLEPIERYQSIVCVRSLEIVVSTTLCVYNSSQDIYVSASILSSGIFEPDVTSKGRLFCRASSQ